MNTYELKQYIVDNNKTKELLEKLECTNIKEYTKEYRCSTVKCSSSTATRIKKDNLKIRVFADDKEIYGDIITLVMDLKEFTFSKSMKYIHNILGLKYNGIIKQETNNKRDILDIFKKAKGKYFNYSVDELKIYHEDILREFIKIPYIEWIREGIMPYTQKVFGVGYSRKQDRVIVPWRYWSGNSNDYTGIIGRTLNEDYDILNIPKYFPLISFPKSMNLFGLQENYKDIQEKGEVIVYESEKSVMHSHSLFIRNTVALGGHELSDEHIKILLSLDVNIIIAMDNDMKEDLSKDMCNRLKRFRKTGYIYDNMKLAGNKSSPIDKGLKVFNALYKRIKWIN